MQLGLAEKPGMVEHAAMVRVGQRSRKATFGSELRVPRSARSIPEELGLDY